MSDAVLTSGRARPLGPAAPAALAAALSLGVAVAIGAAAWLEGETVALAILLATAALPVLIFVGAQTLRWQPGFAVPVGVALLVVQCATFRIRDIADKSIDIQILLKLACIGGMLLLAATALRPPRVGRAEQGVQPAGLFVWIAFLGYTILTSLYSVSPATSFIETVSNLAAFLYLWGLQRQLGADRLVRALIASCVVLCGLSLVAYVAMPELGRMADWVDGAFVPTSRLSGVFGTANAAGAAAAIGVILTVLFSGLGPRRWTYWAILAPMLACLVLTNNRMAVFAVALALAYVYLTRGGVALKLAVGVLTAGVLALLIANFGDAILGSLSRSGSAEEITSATGRSRIWAVVLELWSQQPLFGYGEGSAKFILPKHPLLFAAAAHAHNLYLNILFSGGIVGLGLFVTGLIMALRTAIARRDHALIALFVFECVYGLTEPSIGGLVSFLPISIYALAVLTYDPQTRRRAPAFAPGR